MHFREQQIGVLVNNSLIFSEQFFVDKR